MAELAEVPAFEDLQRLEQRDALAPDVARVDLVAAVIDRDTVLDRHFEACQVGRRHKATVPGMVIGDRIGNRPAVEEVVHGAQFFVTVAARPALGFDHAGDAAA